MDSTQKNKILNQFVARRLIQYRIHQGMSQERLAKHLSLSLEQIQRVESGTLHLEAIRLYEACQLFGTSLAAFFKCYKGFEEQYQRASGELSLQAVRNAAAMPGSAGVADCASRAEPGPLVGRSGLQA